MGASYGLYCLVSANGVVRLAMPLLLTGVILLFRERNVFQIKKGAVVAFLILCMGWMVSAMILQVRLGREAQHMLDLYKSDTQGITYRSVTATGPFYYTIATMIYTDWHAHLFRREFGCQKNPTILTPWLYKNLYLAPEKFFETASEIGCGLYVSSKCPKAVIAYGHNLLTEEQKVTLNTYFESLNQSEVGWKRFLPGRLKVMFPAEDFFLNLVRTEEFQFVAENGLPYTLYIQSEK